MKHRSKTPPLTTCPTLISSCNYQESNNINNLLLCINNNDIPVNLYDVANQTNPFVNNSISQYIKNHSNIMPENPRYDIFVLNSACAKNLLKLPIVYDIQIYNGTIISSLLSPTLNNEYLKKYVFLIITPNSIECDDRILMYIAYTINNKTRTTIYSDDDFTRIQHGKSTPVDIRLLHEIGKEVVPSVSNYVRINNIANIISRGRLRTHFDSLSTDTHIKDKIDAYSRNINGLSSHPRGSPGYYNKYLKYKKKYIELKNRLTK
jgi:hypothetical protein